MASKRYNAFINLKLNDNISRGAKKASNNLDRLNAKAKASGFSIQKLNKVGQDFRRRGLRNITRGAMMLAPLGLLAKTAVTWEKGLAKISTMTDHSLDETKKIYSKKLQDIAASTGSSLSKISEATYQALSAGVPEDKVFNFIRTASKLAIGGHTDVTTSVEGLTNAMNVWGTSAKRAGDILVAAQRVGKTDVGKIANSLGQVSMIAKNLGITFEETAGSMAVLAKAGLETRQAGTAMRGMMTALMKQTPQAIALTEKIGFAFNKETIQAKGLTGTMVGLVEHINKYTDSEAERSQILAGIIGRVRGLNAILGLTAKDGMKTYQDFQERAKDGNEALKDSYTKMSQSQAVQWSKLKTRLKILSISLGKELIPLLKDLAKAFIPILKSIVKWVRENPTLVRWIMKTVIVLGSLKIAVGLLQFGFGSLLIKMAKSETAIKGVKYAFLGLKKVIPMIGTAFKGLLKHPALIKMALIVAGITKLIHSWQTKAWQTKEDEYTDETGETVKRAKLSTADKMLEAGGGYDIEAKQKAKQPKMFEVYKAPKTSEWGDKWGAKKTEEKYAGAMLNPDLRQQRTNQNIEIKQNITVNESSNGRDTANEINRLTREKFKQQLKNINNDKARVSP